MVAGAGDMLCQLYGVGLSQPGRLAEVAGTASIVAAYSEQADLDDRVMSLRTVTGGWANFGITDGAGACMSWLAGLLSGSGGRKLPRTPVPSTVPATSRPPRAPLLTCPPTTGTAAIPASIP